MNSRIDFTAYRHPVLAVGCPTCRSGPGSPCKRPSEHKAADFHSRRKTIADLAFIAQHGEDASIERTERGWRIDPRGRLEQAS